MVFFDVLPFEALYMECINDLLGNSGLFFLGHYSYITDITSLTERTTRIGILDGIDYIGSLLGTYISGPIFENFGYYAVFGSSCGIAILGLINVIFFVQESNTVLETRSEVVNRYLFTIIICLHLLMFIFRENMNLDIFLFVSHVIILLLDILFLYQTRFVLVYIFCLYFVYFLHFLLLFC